MNPKNYFFENELLFSEFENNENELQIEILTFSNLCKYPLRIRECSIILNLLKNAKKCGFNSIRKIFKFNDILIHLR